VEQLLGVANAKLLDTLATRFAKQRKTAGVACAAAGTRALFLRRHKSALSTIDDLAKSPADLDGLLQRMVPSEFQANAPSGLPGMEMQRLAYIVLPKLEKATGAALAVLAALPAEVALVDFEDASKVALRAKMQQLKGAEMKNGASTDQELSSDFVAAVHLVQLMVRGGQLLTADPLAQGAGKGGPFGWVTDDLSTFVPVMITLALRHPVPLVRMGALQALQLLCQARYVATYPFRGSVQKAFIKAVDDPRWCVRRVARVCYNQYLCATG